LQGEQLFIGHNVWVYLLTEQVSPLFRDIELVHPNVIHHRVQLVGEHLTGGFNCDCKLCVQILLLSRIKH
jgi:hypothetical protein